MGLSAFTIYCKRVTTREGG